MDVLHVSGTLRRTSWDGHWAWNGRGMQRCVGWIRPTKVPRVVWDGGVGVGDIQEWLGALRIRVAAT